MHLGYASEKVGQAWPLANSSLIKSLVLAFLKIFSAIFELSAIDLVGKPLLVSTVEQFLGLWNVN